MNSQKFSASRKKAAAEVAKKTTKASHPVDSGVPKARPEAKAGKKR